MTTSIPTDLAATFIGACPHAAFVTLRPDGSPHTARVELAILDGEPWCTASDRSVRVRNLHRDPRCSLFVFDEHPTWLGLDATASVVAGADAATKLVDLLRARHPRTPSGMVRAHDDDSGRDALVPVDAYRRRVIRSGLVAIHVEPNRLYGNLPEDPGDR